MGKKLLVADDSVTIQKVIKLALSSEGYDILAVSEGIEAIRAIQEERPDVVLIDIALPGADAYAVKRAINANAEFGSIGFVLMASAFERVDEKLVDEVGFQGRLIKPFDPSHLRKAVADLMTAESNESTESDDNEHTLPSFTPPMAVEDLPPVQDMHPTIAEDSSPRLVTEEEFHLDAPPDMAIPSVPPPPPAMSVEEEKTEPGFRVSEGVDIEAVQRTLENDIKDLTESTIKMSGLDEFQWNLDDSRKMKASASATQIPVAPLLSESTKELPRPNASDRRTSPLKTVINIPARPIDDGGSNFPIELDVPAAQKVPIYQPPSGSDLISGRDYVPPSTPTPTVEVKAPITPPAITRAEIEEMVRRDLEAVIEKLAKEIVPQVAENLIRREIERLLSETS